MAEHAARDGCDFPRGCAGETRPTGSRRVSRRWRASRRVERHPERVAARERRPRGRRQHQHRDAAHHDGVFDTMTETDLPAHGWCRHRRRNGGLDPNEPRPSNGPGRSAARAARSTAPSSQLANTSSGVTSTFIGTHATAHGSGRHGSSRMTSFSVVSTSAAPLACASSAIARDVVPRERVVIARRPGVPPRCQPSACSVVEERVGPGDARQRQHRALRAGRAADAPRVRRAAARRGVRVIAEHRAARRTPRRARTLRARRLRPPAARRRARSTSSRFAQPCPRAARDRRATSTADTITRSTSRASAWCWNPSSSTCTVHPRRDSARQPAR